MVILGGNGEKKPDQEEPAPGSRFDIGPLSCERNDMALIMTQVCGEAKVEDGDTGDSFKVQVCSTAGVGVPAAVFRFRPPGYPDDEPQCQYVVRYGDILLAILRAEGIIE